MIDKLDELSETSSKEDILEASRGILSTLANVQEVSLLLSISVLDTNKIPLTMGFHESHYC